jgi:hypothetical protein
MDRDFGLIHVKLQPWFPLPIQVYVNGHEWLARKLEQNGIGYTKLQNVFLWMEDFARAQKFSYRFCSLNWPRLLNRYAKKVSAQQSAIRSQRSARHLHGLGLKLNADG